MIADLGPKMLCFGLKCIVCYLIVLHGIALHIIVSYGIFCYRMVLHGIVLYCIALYCIVSYGILCYPAPLHGIAYYCVVGFGARAVSRKTIYFIKFIFKRLSQKMRRLHQRY